MLRSKRFALAPLVVLAAAGGLASLVVDSTGCTGDTEVPVPADASSGADASSPKNDGGPHAGDGGTDATVPTTDGGTDGGPSAVDASDASAEGGIDCAAVVAKMLSAPILPPSGWFGLDLSRGGVADGGAGGGGLTIDQADILACATSVEPDVLEAGTLPSLPGARTATFGSTDGGASVTVAYNLDSRVIWQVLTAAPSTSTLRFHARPGGAYPSTNPDGGVNEYEVAFGPDGDGGVGYVHKNGVDFPADWNDWLDDAGAAWHVSPWANEIYDGIMATFAPNVPAAADCRNVPYDRPIVTQRESACLVDGFVLGVRPLGFYLEFAYGTNQAQYMYGFWPGGWPSCTSPRAAVESMDNLAAVPVSNFNSAIGPSWSGLGIGGLIAAAPVTNSAGLLASEANALAGCGATSVAAPDPGYSAEQWGSGEMELEYNPDSGVAYKVIAKQGYNGSLDLPSYQEDGGLDDYGVQIGSITMNGAPVTLDWADGDAGTLNATVTDMSNGWFAYSCGITDTDCVQAGDCTIVPDDGQGHSSVTLQQGPALVGNCPDFHPITVVFAKGTSAPVQIIATNPGGQ